MKLLVLSVAAVLRQEQESGAVIDPGGSSFADVTWFPGRSLPRAAPFAGPVKRAAGSVHAERPRGALEDVEAEAEARLAPRLGTALLMASEAEPRLRPLARLRALGRDLDSLEWAVPSARAAYARALLVCAGVVTAQTLAPHAALPPAACALAARVEGWRAANELLVTTASAVGIYGAADVLTQTLEQKQGPPRVRRGVVQTGVDISVHVSRVLRSAATSGFVSGYAAFFYYRWLSGALPRDLGIAGVVVSNVVDLMMYRPLKYMVYIALQALLRGEPREILDEIRYKMPEIWKQQLRYWAVANLLKFSVVPVRLRAMVSSLLGVPFSMYLSWMANRDCSVDDDSCDIEAVLWNQWELDEPDEPLSPELAAVDAAIEEAVDGRANPS